MNESLRPERAVLSLLNRLPIGTQTQLFRGVQGVDGWRRGKARGDVTALWHGGIAALAGLTLLTSSLPTGLGYLSAGLFLALGALFWTAEAEGRKAQWGLYGFALFVGAAAGLTGGLVSPLAPLLLSPLPLAFFWRLKTRDAALASAAGLAATLAFLMPGAPVSAAALALAVAAGLWTSALSLAAFLACQTRVEALETTAEDHEAALAGIDAADDAVMLHDETGRVTVASAAADHILGAASETLEGALLLDAVALVDRRDVRKAMARTLYTGRATQIAYRPAADETRWAETRFARIEEADGAAKLISITRDITAQHNAVDSLIAERDAAVAASQAKSQFLANMSHELRTPLNAIIGFSDMMKAETFGPLGHDKYKDYAALIQDSGAHLLDLINDVLDMSKIEADKYELSLGALNIADTLTASVALTRVAAEKAGVAVTVSTPQNLGPIEADARAVKQIVLNLVSNALKFTPAGGKVRVSATLKGDAAVLRIADTGVGIPPADLKRLGERYAQANIKSLRGGAGTGLGLALVRALVDLHGGDLTIESAEGAGTLVTVRLPVRPDATIKAPDAPSYIIRERDISSTKDVRAQIAQVEDLREELEVRRGAA